MKQLLSVCALNADRRPREAQSRESSVQNSSRSISIASSLIGSEKIFRDVTDSRDYELVLSVLAIDVFINRLQYRTNEVASN
jgi:hypothetical protein